MYDTTILENWVSRKGSNISMCATSDVSIGRCQVDVQRVSLFFFFFLFPQLDKNFGAYFMDML